jgi:hypothetical protein
MAIDFSSVAKFRRKTVWPEEELGDLVCDVTCAVVTVILRV